MIMNTHTKTNLNIIAHIIGLKLAVSLEGSGIRESGFGVASWGYGKIQEQALKNPKPRTLNPKP